MSCCLSSATAAWIAAVIVAIRAIFAAGLRPKVPPISLAKIFSAASIASTALSVAVFIGRRSGSLANKKGRAFTSIGNPNLSEAVPCASLGRDGSNLRSRRRGDPRSEYSGPSANRPIDRASGLGANRVHSRRAPARTAVPRQVRSRRAWVTRGQPVLMPPRLGRWQMQGSKRAFQSPKGT